MLSMCCSVPPQKPGCSSSSGGGESIKHSSHLYDVMVQPHQVPIIYRPEYNITFLGFEKLHPFDSGKWGKVIQVGAIFHIAN